MLPFIDATYTPYVATFVFVFAIMFGVLSFAKILGFDKRINAAIAAVIAFFATSYEPFVVGMAEYMPVIAAIFVVIFFIVFLKKIFGKDEKEKGKPSDMLPIGIALAFLLIVLAIMWDRIYGFVPYGFDASNVLWIIGIIIIVIIFWVAYKHKPTEK